MKKKRLCFRADGLAPSAGAATVAARLDSLPAAAEPRAATAPALLAPVGSVNDRPASSNPIPDTINTLEASNSRDEIKPSRIMSRLTPPVDVPDDTDSPADTDSDPADVGEDTPDTSDSLVVLGFSIRKSTLMGVAIGLAAVLLAIIIIRLFSK